MIYVNFNERMVEKMCDFDMFDCVRFLAELQVEISDEMYNTDGVDEADVDGFISYFFSCIWCWLVKKQDGEQEVKYIFYDYFRYF